MHFGARLGSVFIEKTFRFSLKDVPLVAWPCASVRAECAAIDVDCPAIESYFPTVSNCVFSLAGA